MVETSLLMEAAVVRKARSSRRAGLDEAGLDDAVGLCCVEALGVEVVPGVLWMDFMAPVWGMERAMAKNSSVRSVMVACVALREGELSY